MRPELNDIKNNLVHKKMLNVFGGSEVLFIEGDNSLSDAIGNLEHWLLQARVKYNCLYNVSGLPLDYIVDQISLYDIICFETTWVTDVSKQIKLLVAALKSKKIIVECYIHEPSWWRKPQGVLHDIYVLKSSDEDMDEWEFYKLRTKKGIWEK